MKHVLLFWLSCLWFHAIAQTIAIQNVNVIPMDGDYVRSQQTVLIENGVITRFDDSSKVTIPKRARVVDGTGKYLLPGLMDMHVHFFTEEGISAKYLPEESKLMLANGITTARVMCGDSVYLNLKKQIARGKTPGPELFVASPQLVGQWPFKGLFFGAITDTPEKARTAVQQFQKAGYDAIKVTFFIKPGPYGAIIQTARELRMPVTGHVGPDVGLERALAAGQQVEHFDEFLEQLLPDSAKSHACVSGTGVWDKKDAWPAVATLDESKIPALVQKIKSAGIAVTPTNYFLHSSFGTGMSEDSVRQLPDFQYIPKSLKADRFETRAKFWTDPPPEDLRKRYVALRQHLTRALHSAQVPLLCGSDSPEWFHVQGFSVHYELQALVDAGLTPFAALETATINPARYLGIANRSGTIAIGMQANLLLLDANPMDDIANTRRISGVFCGGKYYDRRALDRMLEEAKVLGQQ